MNAKKITLEALAEMIGKTATKKNIESLARMAENSFAEAAKQEDLLALTKRVDALNEQFEKLEASTGNRFMEILGELKEIREDIKEVDCRADVVDLEVRIEKLEKKRGMQ